ncbi:MAG: hypothetical protein IID41_03980 [Planctomycetes bacterium]|nr:hypothetical protein [Planctomycetota bacterium]
MIGLVSVVMGLCVAFVDLPASASDLDAAISKLEKWKRDYGRGDLNVAVDTIRSQMPVGDRVIVDRLLDIVRNEDLPDAVRSETLKVACEKADASIARELVTLGTGWAMDAAQKLETSQKGAKGQGLLLYSLVTDGIPRFQRLLPEPDEQKTILSFLRVYATRIATWGKAHKRALQLIAESPAPLDMRRACALEVIRANEVSGPIRDLFDPSWLPRLRALVRESPDAEHFHWVSLSVLAHYGDQEILPVLETWRPRVGELSRNSEKILDGYIWKIRIQHPPTKLLDYIGSGKEPKGQQKRVWAVKRVVALGLPKALIRDAILKYAEHVTDVGKHGYRIGLSGLKKSALELGVLREDDLADVLVLEIAH